MHDPAPTCSACARPARPGEAFCCPECERAYIHEHEQVRDRESVELQRDAGRSVWIGGRHLGLQNSA